MVTTLAIPICFGARSSCSYRLETLRSYVRSSTSWMWLFARSGWTKKSPLLMKELWLARDCLIRIINHFWSNTPSEVCLPLWGTESTRKFCTLILLRRRLTTSLTWPIRSTSGSRPSTILFTLISSTSATMTNTSSSRTWWRPVSAYSSETGKFLILWRLSQTALSWRLTAKIRLLEPSHLAEWFRWRNSVPSSRQSALYQTRKRTVTTFSEASTANISATSAPFPVTHNPSLASASYSRICCTLTSQKCATTWVSWASHLLRPCSPGSPSALSAF